MNIFDMTPATASDYCELAVLLCATAVLLYFIFK